MGWFTTGRSATRRSLTATAAVLAVTLAACGGSGADDPGADGAGAGTQDGAEAAVLAVLDPGVDIADEPEDPAVATFRAGADGEGLVVGDLVRTDDAGFAEVAWFEGALARVDADTLYALVEFDSTPGEAVVVTDLDVGRIWNRLRADEVATYEVVTDVGTAAVRGTAFWVHCDGAGCTFAVLEGVVVVTTTDGTPVTLEAGQQVTVDGDGVPGGVARADYDDPWVVRNAGLDVAAGFAPIEPATDTVVAGGCPLVDVPDGWVEQADPEAEGPASDFCRYSRPDAGGNEFAVIEWYSEASEQFRTQVDQNRPFFEQFRDEVAASDCAEGMRDEFVEVMEPLGEGELYAYAWRVARGPLPATFDECTDGIGNSFHSVVIGGQVFALRPTEGVSIGCDIAGGGQSAEEWDAHVDCLYEKFAERQDLYRALAATLLGT